MKILARKNQLSMASFYSPIFCKVEISFLFLTILLLYFVTYPTTSLIFYPYKHSCCHHTWETQLRTIPMTSVKDLGSVLHFLTMSKSYSLSQLLSFYKSLSDTLAHERHLHFSNLSIWHRLREPTIQKEKYDKKRRPVHEGDREPVFETRKRTGGEPEEARSKDGEEFSQWDSEATQRKHGAILQVSKTVFFQLIFCKYI